VGLLSRPLRVGPGRISRVWSAVIRIRPLGRIGISHRVIEGVVRVLVAAVVLGIVPGRLRNAGGGLLLFHARILPESGRAKLRSS
jgi:hypothetical protein